MKDLLENISVEAKPDGQHGLVRLVDVMPRLVPEDQTVESAIVQAARVSYGQGTKTVLEDEGLIRYLMRHRHCYDAQTEVLTSRGFVAWPAVKEEDLLGIWDQEKNTLCYEKPAYLTTDEYSGWMYQVNHGGVDLLVTPEHSMYVKLNKAVSREDKWRLISARELGDRSMVRYNKLAPLNQAEKFNYLNIHPDMFEVDDIESLLEFFGFFIGDGGKGSRNCISFNLKKDRKKTYLRYLCTMLGLSVKESFKDDGRVVFWVEAENIGSIFTDLFYGPDKEKKIPDFILKLNTVEAKKVVEGLKNSDGSQKRGAWEYFTSVESLAQSIQILALHAGIAAHINPRVNGMFGVMMLSRMTEPVINQGKVNTKFVQYSGKVYCAKTRTGILVVRRGGKIVLSGNTTPYEMVETKWLHVMPITTARQWIRHRTANVNEYSARYSEVKDRFYIPPADDVRKQMKIGNKQSSEGQAVSAQEFTETLDRHCQKSMIEYKEALGQGVGREQARWFLPTNVYTEWYWKIDLHNLFHFLSLRMDSHAQKEIRIYADAMFEILKPIAPVACQAFIDYRLESVTLSRLEREAIGKMKPGMLVPTIESKSKGERLESYKKFRDLGFIPTVQEGDE